MLNKFFAPTLWAPVACAILTAAAMAGNPVDSGWQRVSSTSGSFSVMMPGMPQENTKEIETKAGKTVLHSFRYVSGSQEYMVTYNDYPTNLDVDLTLSGVRDGEIGNGRILTDSNVTLDGHRGKKITAWVKGKLFASEFYVVGSRLYQVIYTSDPLHALLDAPTYLNSFHIQR